MVSQADSPTRKRAGVPVAKNLISAAIMYQLRSDITSNHCTIVTNSRCKERQCQHTQDAFETIKNVNAHNIILSLRKISRYLTDEGATLHNEQSCTGKSIKKNRGINHITNSETTLSLTTLTESKAGCKHLRRSPGAQSSWDGKELIVVAPRIIKITYYGSSMGKNYSNHGFAKKTRLRRHGTKCPKEKPGKRH